MTITDVAAGLPAVFLTPPPDAGRMAERQIHGGFACDMLSLVISGVQPGEAWFTILNSMNVIAVAVLSDCPLVILTDGVTLEPAVLERAIAQNITVASTPLRTFEACVRLDALLSGRCGPG